MASERRPRILIVEDSILVAMEIEGIVGHLKMSVVGPAPSVQAAMQLLEAHEVDAALLDINLDGDLVFPVADALREKDVPFAFLTGYDESIIPERLRDHPRLGKPVSYRLLEDALAQLGAR